MFPVPSPLHWYINMLFIIARASLVRFVIFIAEGELLQIWSCMVFLLQDQPPPPLYRAMGEPL